MFANEIGGLRTRSSLNTYLHSGNRWLPIFANGQALNLASIKLIWSTVSTFHRQVMVIDLRSWLLVVSDGNNVLERWQEP